MFTFSRSKRYIRYCNSDNRLLSLEIIMKVICAGASKTGTKSLAKALRILGYNEVYDAEEAAEFAFKEWEEIWLGKQTSLDVILDSVYSKNVEAVVDIPHSAFFEQFLERWPEAKVILTLRDEDDWFQSFKSMIDWANNKYWPIHYLRYISPTLNRMLNWQVWLFTTTVGPEKPHPFLWKWSYRRHNKYVKAVVPSQQLLEYRVAEGWQPLCEFLGKPVPGEKFPFENSADSDDKPADRVMQESWIAKQIAKELGIVLAIIPLSLAVVFGLYYYL
ncbi:uncharacterized protein LOC143458954 [Clavelina lepadiformis]|uniref:uncharacterized protein LOC143458954 n=1 Tax=Clavelina lepadiformis TaxID=159417 RepID=UPI0040437D8C